MGDQIPFRMRRFTGLTIEIPAPNYRLFDEDETSSMLSDITADKGQDTPGWEDHDDDDECGQNDEINYTFQTNPLIDEGISNPYCESPIRATPPPSSKPSFHKGWSDARSRTWERLSVEWETLRRKPSSYASFLATRVSERKRTSRLLQVRRGRLFQSHDPTAGIDDRGQAWEELVSQWSSLRVS